MDETPRTTERRFTYDLPREIVVVLSSPGDVASARDRLDDVIRDVGAFTRHLGIATRSWRYERDALPHLGADPQVVVNEQLPREYDVYVGVMCRRLGTPTGRAASGTIEEFESARRSRERTGRPAVFFYFCSDEGHDDEQVEKVRRFKQSYPGIYRQFATDDQFASLVKHDLVLWFFDAVLGSRFRSAGEEVRDGRRAPSRVRALVGGAGADPAHGPRDRSLAMLHELLRLETVLTVEEQAVLVAVSRFLADGEPDPSGLRRTCAAMGWQESMVGSLLEMATLATGEDSVGALRGNAEALRTGLIVALLRIGRALEGDRGGLAGTSRLPPPPHRVDAGSWIRFLTREIRVRPGGFVQFVLEVPASTWIEPLKRCTSLRMEKLWQDHRHILAPASVCIVVEPSEVVLSPPDTIDPPDGVLEAVEEAGLRYEIGGPSLSHLGEDPLGEVDQLLPVPGTAVAGTVEFQLESDRPHVLVLSRDGLVCLERAASGGRVVELDPHDLEPEGVYDWTLRVRSRTGEERPVRIGRLQRLSAMQEKVVDGSHRLPDRQRLLLWRHLGLYDACLRELWPNLQRPETPTEDKQWALALLQSGLAFTLKESPGLEQVDRYRTAAASLCAHILATPAGSI